MKLCDKNRAFTLIEVVISLMIFTLMSIALLQALSLSINMYSKGSEDYHQVLKGENLIYKIIEELHEFRDDEPESAELEGICNKYKDEEGNYSISISKGRYDNVYIIEINYKDNEKNNICTMIKCP